MPYAALVTHAELRASFEVPEKYVGYEVLDPKGDKIGSAKEIFTNVRDEPEYIEVKVGFFRLRSVLIPVGFVVVNDEQRALILE